MATNSTILNSEDIAAAKAAITAYNSTCTELFTTLDTTITGLSAHFQGDAATGFAEYYQTLHPKLNQPTLMENLTQFLTTVETTLLQTVDPELKTRNTSQMATE